MKKGEPRSWRNMDSSCQLLRVEPTRLETLKHEPPIHEQRGRARDHTLTGGPLDQPALEAPRILLTATLRWTISARLAISFTDLGCHVEVACPAEHPAAKTRAVARIHAYGVFNVLRSLRAAIESAEPDLIIPCDDGAALHLHELYESCIARDWAEAALRALIARSLGNPEACSLATRRGTFMDLAGQEARVPKTTGIADDAALEAWIAANVFPAVLKIDRTWGGQGVSIVGNASEARTQFQAMASRPALSRAVVRTLLERDPSFVVNTFRTSRPTAVLQKLIIGMPANRAVACWQGKVLGGISVLVLETRHPMGPATVVRVIENAEMADAATRLVRRLGLTGLWGLDFVLESATGDAYLVEMNPRATPICHLALGENSTLSALIHGRLAGLASAPVASPASPATIALFPGEWQRDAASPYLRSEFEDIPWCEPELVAECMRKPWSERGALARLWSAVRPADRVVADEEFASGDFNTIVPREVGI